MMRARRLDLTGDRPIPRKDARALAAWWRRAGVVTMRRAYVRRERRDLWHVVCHCDQDRQPVTSWDHK